MRTRQQWETIEEKILAPYAQKAAQSKGRKYPEPEHPFRSAYQRDKDRIIHSRAFRRLEYKTQVFVNHEGDHYRTRLTHTVETATIARTIARALRLNEDLTEAIALAHDLGHPPFGHSGEAALNELMAEEGGFEHNKQSLRIVETLEKKYPPFPGLNLTWEVREGIIKHRTSYDQPTAAPDGMESFPSLEAQIVDKADEIAYNCHDLDDGLASGLLTEKQLSEVALWQESYERVLSDFPKTLDREILHYYTVRTTINALVTDLVQETEDRIASNKIQSVQDVRRLKKIFVAFSDRLSAKDERLKQFLHKNLYLHPKVSRMNTRMTRILKDLFEHYLAHPETLKISTKVKAVHTPLKRVICDYIAGMTDRFAIEEHHNLIR